MKITTEIALEYVRLYNNLYKTIAIICSYLQRKNDKVFKFHLNDFFNFERRASLFKRNTLKGLQN